MIDNKLNIALAKYCAGRGSQYVSVERFDYHILPVVQYNIGPGMKSQNFPAMHNVLFPIPIILQPPGYALFIGTMHFSYLPSVFQHVSEYAWNSIRTVFYKVWIFMFVSKLKP